MGLAKRTAKTKYADENGSAQDAVALPEREDVSFEDDPTVAQALADSETTEQADAPPKPTMRDVFGPGGFLERCMIGGYEHRRGAIGDGGAGARRVRKTSPRDFGSRHGNREDAGVFAAGDLQRAARGDFDGHEIAARAALPEGYSVFAEALCAGVESGGDEGAVEFFVPQRKCIRWRISRC